MTKANNRFVAFLMAFFAMSVTVCAQYEDDASNIIRQNYTFGDGKLDWNEYSERHKSVVIDGDKLVISCKKEKEDVLAVARLSFQPRKNFKLDYAMTVPKLDEENMFGVLFNYQDDDNYNGILFNRKKFYFVTRENGVTYKEKSGDIKFKGKKDVDVNVSLIRVGNKLHIEVNNMAVYERIGVKMRHPFCGFYTSGKSSLQANSIGFEQMTRDDEDEDE